MAEAAAKRGNTVTAWKGWRNLKTAELQYGIEVLNTKRFDNIMLKTKTVSSGALPEGI